MGRRVLHVPAADLRPGDKVSFHDLVRFIGLENADPIVTDFSLDHSDGTLYISFGEDHPMTAYYDPAYQFRLLLERSNNES